MGILVVLSLSFTAAWSIWLLLCHLAHRRRLSSIPAPRSYPVIGHALIVKPDPQGFVDQVMGMASLFPSPRMVLFWLGPKPVVMLYSAELVERILTNPKHLNKGFAYDLLHPWLGLSLLTSDREEWRPRRKQLTPTFHYDILKDFLPIFNEHSRILVKKLQKLSANGEKVEFLSLVSLCALDAICETSMGKSVHAQENEDSEYVQAIHDINQIVQERTTNPFMWHDYPFTKFGDGVRHEECLRILHGFTRKVIEEREAELEARDFRLEGRPAFLDLLLSMVHEGSMRREDVQPEVDTFMFEGHDTTSTGLAWAIHLIGNDPRVQRKVQEEVDSVWEDGEVTLEGLSHLKYTECCIKESLRLFPSVPIIMRKLGCDQDIGGYTVPEGTHILLNQYLVHRDPAQWEDPEEFRPERFLVENSSGRHPFAFVPFSAGSRNCIGQRFAIMEEKTMLAWILRHFNIVSCEKRCEMRTKMELIMRPENGIHAIFKQRVTISQ